MSKLTERELERRIDLIELVDDLGDGPDWGEWSCEYLDKDGEWKEGFIQSDGHMTAYETLTDAEGNEVNIYY